MVNLVCFRVPGFTLGLGITVWVCVERVLGSGLGPKLQLKSQT